MAEPDDLSSMMWTERRGIVSGRRFGTPANLLGAMAEQAGRKRQRNPRAASDDFPCRVCGARTVGKPACAEHVAEVMPYAAQVAAEIAARVKEAERLNRGGRPDPHGVLADELHDCLALGPQSAGLAGRLLGLSLEAAETLARSMARAGRIVARRRGRGLECVRVEAEENPE